jgi:hypothetical protein
MQPRDEFAIIVAGIVQAGTFQLVNSAGVVIAELAPYTDPQYPTNPAAALALRHLDGAGIADSGLAWTQAPPNGAHATRLYGPQAPEFDRPPQIGLNSSTVGGFVNGYQSVEVTTGPRTGDPFAVSALLLGVGDTSRTAQLLTDGCEVLLDGSGSGRAEMRAGDLLLETNAVGGDITIDASFGAGDVNMVAGNDVAIDAGNTSVITGVNGVGLASGTGVSVLMGAAGRFSLVRNTTRPVYMLYDIYEATMGAAYVTTGAITAVPGLAVSVDGETDDLLDIIATCDVSRTAGGGNYFQYLAVSGVGNLAASMLNVSANGRHSVTTIDRYVFPGIATRTIEIRAASAPLGYTINHDQGGGLFTSRLLVRHYIAR